MRVPSDFHKKTDPKFLPDPGFRKCKKRLDFDRILSLEFRSYIQIRVPKRVPDLFGKNLAILRQNKVLRSTIQSSLHKILVFLSDSVTFCADLINVSLGGSLADWKVLSSRIYISAIVRVSTPVDMIIKILKMNIKETQNIALFLSKKIKMVYFIKLS